MSAIEPDKEIPLPLIKMRDGTVCAISIDGLSPSPELSESAL